MPKIYLVDGNAYIHRAYHALPPLTTSRGDMVNAVYGFIRMLLKLIRNEQPEYIAVCFDYPALTFRHGMDASYKANRKSIDDELRSQMPLSRDAVKVLNIPMIEKQGYEADDVIATLAHQAAADGAEVVIVTGDKDAAQLVNERIKIWNESKGVLIDSDGVKERYGLAPAQMTDMFALMGDTSDNVPGIKGIGEKTAVKLLQEFGSLEGIYNNLEALKGKTKELIAQGKTEAERSKMLVTLCDDVPLELGWRDCGAKLPEKDSLKEFLGRMEFTSMIKELMPEEAPESAVAAAPGTPIDEVFSVNIVCTAEDLELLVARIRAAGACAVDLETTSLVPATAQIVGISIAVDTKVAYYIPVGHCYPDGRQQLAADKALSLLRELLESPDIKKYGQNIKYDLLVLRHNGVRMSGIYFDSMVASYCLNPSRNNHNLKGITLDYLGLRMTAIEDLIGKGAKQITMDRVDIERTARYAGADAVAVMLLAEKFGPEIREKKLEKLFYDIEMPLISVLADMEDDGIMVNRRYLEDLSQRFEGEIRRLQSEIFDLAGQEFNPNSPKQLSVILFEKLQLPVIRRTKTGYCTDEEVLRTLSRQHALPAKLIEFREVQKLKSTYVDALLALSDTVTGRVRTSFNQTVTATGRLSSSEPNLQNIPIRSEYGREIRKAFVASPGNILLSADYSQIDLRVLAHISGDAVLMKAFSEGEDVHRATAEEIFHVGAAAVTPDQRRIAKTINFGIIYGMSAYGLSSQLGIDPKEAKSYIELYFYRYKGVKEWLGAIIQQARSQGFVTTLLGRIRYLPEINAANGQIRAFAERTATNTPIQGTSADIIKVAMINIHRLLHTGKFKTRMLVQVHDELLFDVPEEEKQTVQPLIRTEMEQALRLNIPVVVDLKTGMDWSDMQKVER